MRLPPRTFDAVRASSSVRVLRIENDLYLLAEAAARGDRPALDDLVRELQADVVRTTRLIVGSGSSAAEDAAQDTLTDITRGIRSLENPRAVRTWALRIATRRAFKAVRSERLLRLRHERHLSLPEMDPDPNRRTVELRSAFYALKPSLRAVAVLRLYVGLSEAETASVLSIPVGTAKSQLHAARLELSRALSEAGIAPATQAMSKEQGAPGEEVRL
jgi:RNA polymerase sigma factor (sigma-70 family)